MSMLLVSEVFPPQHGGSGRWFWEVYRRLPRERVVVAAGEHPRAAAFDAAETIACERLPLAMRQWGLRSVAGLRDYLRLAWRLRRMIRREGVVAVHAARCLPEGWLAWMLRRLAGTPYLVYVHGEDIRAAGTSREHAWMVRRVFRDADVVIANSENTARLLREDWGLACGPGGTVESVPAGTAGPTVRVLHPGVDTERFRRAEPDAAVRRRLGWDGRRVVLTVGRLQRRKGHDMLISALASVRRDVPDVLYAIVGDGAERPRLEELVCREGLERHVQLLGEIDDEALVECYQQCDLFALPNREVDGDIEGFGMVLLEAQACGRPVLAGDSGGTRETMRPFVSGHWSLVIGGKDGRGASANGQEPTAKSQQPTGLVIDCTGPGPLAEAVTGLLLDADLRERMGRAAREWAVERFSWPGLAEHAAALFEMIDGHSVRTGVREWPHVAAEQVGP
jgi:phosphatidyl-myo-inositol dimannoside synthase